MALYCVADSDIENGLTGDNPINVVDYSRSLPQLKMEHARRLGFMIYKMVPIRWAKEGGWVDIE